MKDFDPREGCELPITVEGKLIYVKAIRKRTARRHRRGKRSKVVVRVMSSSEYEAEKLTRVAIKR